jgi:hypothetical protein
MKVWGFNCYGVCVALLEESKIEEWNRRYHPLSSKKIISWKKAETT